MKKWIIAGSLVIVLASCKTQEDAQENAASSPQKSKAKKSAPVSQDQLKAGIPESKVKNFNKLDANKDEKLSLEEFTQTVKTSFEKKGDTSDAYKAEAKKRFKRRDQNKDAALSLEEFAGAPSKGGAPVAQKTASTASGVPEAKVKIFKKLDANSDGKLSVEEFTVTVKNSFIKKGDTSDAYKAAAKKRFKNRDKNGDGVLSLEEFAGVSEMPSLPPQ